MFDDRLENFSSLTDGWEGILIGNGASQAINASFAYRSLYEKAQSSVLEHPLTQKDKEVFEHLRTTNFEQALSALSQTQAIGGIFGLNANEVSDAYQRIQKALIEAVHGVHIPWLELTPDSLASINTALRAYNFVFSTNYDLILYWAIMHNPDGFKDYFFGERFDLGNCDIWSQCTKLLFLHGGLHLYLTSLGTVKRKAGLTGNLLDDFGKPIGQERVIPLFITEGTSDDKRRSIYGNDYLSFAYSKLAHHSGSLVILGQSLDETFDKHLIDAIRSGGSKRIGIGIYPPSAKRHSIAAMKGSWHAKFSSSELVFFDSQTHPLTLSEQVASK